MKLILSRKGFDSSYGGIPSPIFPSGLFFSLPIPSKGTGIKYSDISIREHTYGKVVADLSDGLISPDAEAHLDPDLFDGSIKREQGWLPLFGQTGAAETHLENKKVGVGDVFLFFGWFKEIIVVNGEISYKTNAPDLHVIFGWMQIGKIIKVKNKYEFPPWSLYHPHVRRNEYLENDTVYIARNNFSLPNFDIDRPGGGIFRNYHSNLCLTNNNRPRSQWKLPGWMNPFGRKSTLSFHGNPGRWKTEGDSVILNSVNRGQEFVLDCDDYPEALKWVADLLRI